ncbi:MAG: hypothetical protein HW416_576 [Chloroflexi bacterium]|nr:hypothetical protein [Chloroflexota bacterium]
MVTRDDLIAWRERWALVNEVHEAEVRALSSAQKLEQLDALLAFARWLGWQRSEAEVQEVRDRWNRLRRAYGV